MDLIGTSRLHYNIIEKLGEGGMGVVYKALDTKLKREVAIKFLPWRISTNSAMRMRFQIEAQAVATLNHPNIATIYAIEEAKGPDGQDEIFFVMEYIDGQELRQKIKDGVISLVETVDIALQVAEGLNAAHEKGITHRDIKPANIMLTAKGRIKLMDFGLAKIGRGVQLTKTHTTLGTVAYMSPEQARGEKVDHRSDIWSFGVVLYEMLAGSLPFQADHEHALIYAIINNNPRPLSGQRKDVPQPLADIVNRALHKDVDERYQDMQTLILDLHQYADELFSSLRNETHLQNGPTSEKTVALNSLLNAQVVLGDKSESSSKAPSHAPAPSESKSTSRGIAYAGIFSLILIGGLGVWWWSTTSGGDENLPIAQHETSIPDPPRNQNQPVEQGGDFTSLEPLSTENDGPTQPQIEDEEQPEETTTGPPSTGASNNQAETQTAPVVNVTPPDASDASSSADSDDVDTQALQQQAIQAQTVMTEARDRVPGTEDFKSGLPSYATALQTQRNGQNQFDLTNYQEATDLFDQARNEFTTAREEAIARFKAQADESKRLMDQAKARINVQNPDITEFEQATSKEAEGNRAYSENDYERAARLYTEGQQLYARTVDLIANDNERARRIESLTNEAKIQIMDGFEDQNIDKLTSIVNLSNRDRDTWRDIFSSFKNFRLNFVDQNLQELSSTRYQLEFTSVLTYTNNKNEDARLNLTLTGTLVQENDAWSKSKFDLNYNDR